MREPANSPANTNSDAHRIHRFCTIHTYITQVPEVKNYADKLYEELQNAGIEVLYDDRKVSAGVMFSDADLMGVPVRIIASPRNMKEGCCEIVTRDKSVQKKVAVADVFEEVKAMVAQAMEK